MRLLAQALFLETRQAALTVHTRRLLTCAGVNPRLTKNNAHQICWALLVWYKSRECRFYWHRYMAKLCRPSLGSDVGTMRSEEHTSELQSRGHLVCRLLLEKK